MHYIQNQTHIVNEDDVFIVGDSLADLLCAKTIGATFIGTLTGLSGKGAKEELEQHGAIILLIIFVTLDIFYLINNKEGNAEYYRRSFLIYYIDKVVP